MSHLTLIDELMLTYVNKELYFIIHWNKKFKTELNFVKCTAKYNDRDNFLNIKFNEILKKFRQKMYRGENMYSYNNLHFLVSMKRNLSMTGIYPQMFDSTFFSKFF